MQSSLTEVARVAGVSASTVSRYVRGQLRVTPETEDKILHAMDKVGWERPCDSYTSITSVSLIIPELTNPFLHCLRIKSFVPVANVESMCSCMSVMVSRPVKSS